VPDLCLELTSAVLPPEAWPSAVTAVTTLVSARPDLFPDPSVLSQVVPADEATGKARSFRIGAWSTVGGSSGDERSQTAGLAGESCLPEDATWGATITRSLLAAGAERRASSVDLSVGVTADVGVRFFPDEERVRTFLDFSMPLGVGGHCWVDDILGVDAAASRAVISTEVGQDVTLFGDYGCQRFLELMPDGGAGEQALGLVPAKVGTGPERSLGASGADLEADRIVVWGNEVTPGPDG
jgi:hypothetical protein